MFDKFYIDMHNHEGQKYADVKVNKPLDFEWIQEYNLTLRAVVCHFTSRTHWLTLLQSNNALASETTIHIVVEDVNEEIPLIIKSEQATVFEEEPVGTFVTRFSPSYIYLSLVTW